MVADRAESRSPNADGPPITVDILIEAGDWPPESELGKTVSRVVGAAVATIRPMLAQHTELSLVFTDDAEIRKLNLKFRNIDKATNVLSFPAAPSIQAGFGPLLGDIVMAHDTIVREADAQGLTIEAHLAHLILHGFLHLLGYDHEEEAEATAMERLETAILLDLGVANPYA